MDRAVEGLSLDIIDGWCVWIIVGLSLAMIDGWLVWTLEGIWLGVGNCAKLGNNDGTVTTGEDLGTVV